MNDAPRPANAAAAEVEPPWTPREAIVASLVGDGVSVVAPADACAWLGLPDAQRAAWPALWADLPPDAFLRDGGRYRRRRHGSFTVEADGSVVRQPHRAHWQPVDYNALHGGIERWFEPLDDGLVAPAGWSSMMRRLSEAAAAIRPVPGGAAGADPRRWFIEAHAFRIDTAGGIGRPTPEGAHRDGVDLVAVMLVDRVGVKGGETRVFEAAGPAGRRFTLHEPFSLLLLDDARVIHETTPIQPADAAQGGWRDTLVVTVRAGGFLDPPAH